MFPIVDIMGSVVGYSARVAPGGDESQAKYINTPETAVYHKSKALYGIWNAKADIKRQNYVLLVEGNMDVIAAHQAGLRNTVAVSGTALTADQVVTLKRYTENISMLFDMDNAGQKAAERSADLCLESGMNIKVVTLKDGKDAADVAAKDPELLRSAVRQSVPVMEHFLSESLKKNDRNSAEGKQTIAKEVLSHVSHIGNQIEKSHWIKKIAHELDVEEKVVSDVLKSVSFQPTSFRAEKNEPIIEDSSDSFKKRSDVVRDSLVGLIVSSPKIWEETIQNESGNELIKNDPLLSFIFKRGPEVGYSFDLFLSQIEDEKSKNRLNKLHFDAKYQFDQEAVIEYDEDNLRELVVSQTLHYMRELQKERLHSIIKEIKNAEQAGNKDALAKLMGEFTKLSQELK
jgi:DNA primase